MTTHVTIWWLRQDLRVGDNPALAWAAARGEVLPVYIDDEGEAEGGRALGGASRWWLEQSLRALRVKVPVAMRRGRAVEVLQTLIAEHGADAVVWNRCYEPWAVARDKEIKAQLKDSLGVEVQRFNGALLHEPWDVKSGSGTEYKVFTPYWKAARAMPVEAPCPAPEVAWVEGVASEDVRFYPVANEPDWAKGWDKDWRPGEEGARATLQEFIARKLVRYPDGRDLPAEDFTSKISAHLHFGEISPRSIWAAALTQPGAAAEKFLSEIGWREFAHHLLWHYPTMVERNWKRDFDRYPWRVMDGHALRDFEAWKHGRTGYPIVDAGMRQLWQTGWMHNRVRMIVASFLIKHLQIDWREGERWFWDTLVDADAANNAAGWQWVAGSGADASPYFRIFNPMLQGAKFDPDGVYVKRWCPELQHLDAKYIHAPWEAPEMVLRGARVVLGKDYPRPIVEHEAARERALAGYALVKGE